LAELYAATGGNPFFVTEVLGAPGEHVPTTVRDAVLARAARLSGGARAVLDVVSMLPIRADVAMVTSLVTPGVESSGIAAIDEAVESGMLVRDGEAVRIRHGLACRAIEVAVPVARAAELHRSILAFLAESSTADPARLAYHADAAGDSAAVLRYAPGAGVLAARLGAHREAAEQYRRALRHATGAPAAQLAPLWEGLADARERGHWTTASQPGEDQLSDALDASAHAVELWRAVGDLEREAVVMARRSHMLWNAGRRTGAQETARETVALLERVSPGPGAAQAYAALARLHMLAHDDAGAMSLGDIAATNAKRYGDGATLAEALGVVASTQWTTDPDRAVELLTAGLHAARSAGDDLAAAAILCTLGAGAAESRGYQLAEGWLTQAVAWCAERDLDSLHDLALAWQARCHLEQGRWSEATEATTAAIRAPVARGLAAGVGQAHALTVLGRLRSRRGDPDAQAPLEQAWSLVEKSGDLRRLWPVAAARAENAWLSGATERIEALITEPYRLATQMNHPWAAGELGYWLWVAGAETDPAARIAAPYALQTAGDWAGAARLWEQLGCPYEMALAMAGDNDSDRQLDALQRLHSRGAWPAAELIARQLRARGVRNLPRRPRGATRKNPAQLTERQLVVLELLADGLRNADIAGRLHISAKTVDHHVSAILAKLGVESRREAAMWARSAEQDGELEPRPTWHSPRPSRR
jgi:DNA-binding CsgD family transcriptional regulator